MLKYYIGLVLITSAYILFNERGNRIINAVVWLLPNIPFSPLYFPVYFIIKGYQTKDRKQVLNIWLRIAIAAFILYVILWIFLKAIS